MTDNKSLSRREFIKLGGLAAATLPALNQTPHIYRDKSNFPTPELHQFLIRTADKDDPPYEIDPTIYQRFDARNSGLGREVWDSEAQRWISQFQREDEITSIDAVFSKADLAFYAAAWGAARAFGSNAAMHGSHQGMLQLDRLDSAADEVSIENPPLSPGSITPKIKKAARFYGADLVGIAKLDQRWVYEKSFDSASPESAGEIVFVDTDMPVEPHDPEEDKQNVQDALTAMKADDLKEFVLNTLEEIDSQELPPGAPDPFIVKSLPASQLAQMIPLMMDILPESLLALFAQKLEIPFGADEVDPEALSRPRYLQDGKTLAIPKSMQWAVVIAFEMDAEAVACSSTAIGAAAASRGYSRMTDTVSSLAEFIRGLGYNAIPCVDMTALSIPLAIDAGLGELGRNGLLITPQFGPRLQIAKVITDLPLLADQPIEFGAARFCEICQRCAEHCPGEAISTGNPTDQPLNISNNPGVTRWPVDAVRCMEAGQSQGSTLCCVCIQVCPFNQPEGWLYDTARALIGAQKDSLNRFLLNLEADADSVPRDPDAFWVEK